MWRPSSSSKWQTEGARPSGSAGTLKNKTWVEGKKKKMFFWRWACLSKTEMRCCRQCGLGAAAVWLLAGISTEQVPQPGTGLTTTSVFFTVCLWEATFLTFFEEALYQNWFLRKQKLGVFRERCTCVPGHLLTNPVYSGFPPLKHPAKWPWSQLIVMTPVEFSFFFFSLNFMSKFSLNS